jgi:hypothetical protein
MLSMRSEFRAGFLSKELVHLYALSVIERPRLTTKQAAALRDRVMPMLLFMLLCRRRLDVLGFDASHPI